MAETYRISGMQQIAARLDSLSPAATIFEPEIGEDANGSPVPFFAYIDTLRVKVQILSKPEAVLPEGFDELDGVGQRNALHQIMFLQSHLRFELVLEVGQVEVVVAYVGCINRPPFYHFSLMSFLTDAASFPVAAGSKLKARLVDAGWGGPGTNDVIEIWGSARTEAPALSSPTVIVNVTGGTGESIPSNAVYHNGSPVEHNGQIVVHGV
jgi:hypothetical protein